MEVPFFPFLLNKSLIRSQISQRYYLIAPETGFIFLSQKRAVLIILMQLCVLVTELPGVFLFPAEPE